MTQAKVGTIWADGRPLAFREGQTLLEVLRQGGVDLPALCYEPRLPPQGSCRLCMVQLEGQGAPVASCTVQARDGMRVQADPEHLRRYRRTVLEMLLSETPPPGECPRCRGGERCELHRAAERYQARPDRFPRLEPRPASRDPNPFILRDYRWCIACYRCTRVCGEWEMAHAIVPVGRGQDTRIASFPGDRLLESPCTFCGQCIFTCPTGALLDRKSLQQRNGAPVERVKTICPYCGTGCGLQLLVREGRLVGAEPDFANPVSQGSLCIKGQFASWEFVHSPDRLTRPLIRRDGELRPATWEEAYDLVATRLLEIRDTYGPDALVFWSSARATNEANYLMQKLARAVVGTNNVDNCART